MYDELVKRLREDKSWVEQGSTETEHEIAEHIQQAADAIEKLSAYVALYKDGGETAMKVAQEYKAAYIAEHDAIELLQKTQQLRWIPVSELLPKAERKSYWVCTDTGYQCECRWTNNLFGMGESDEWVWSIFDIPQYQKVVAWMPLPDPYEPPKEET